MQERRKVRVAAAQLETGTDLEENLAACLRVIDVAAGEKADLVVLPEFANHLSWYDDADHCRRVSVPLGGPFLAAIAGKAKAHRIHVVVNCTVLRDDGSVTGTSLLFGSSGDLLGTSDKQVLMGHENDFLTRARVAGPVIETPFGRVGLYACMDGVICETPRDLALRGAQILCNSLNSFAPDEAELHVPVRAAENRVFVVAANKVGPLIPRALLAPVSAATGIPEVFLHGAGESQIVAPDGTVLAKAARSGEAVVVADIEVDLASAKRRPDGTDVFRSRRPALYRTLNERPAEPTFGTAAASLEVAICQPRADGGDAVAEACNAVADLVAAGVRLVVLPELFCFRDADASGDTQAVTRSREALEALAAAVGSGRRADTPSYVATSLVDEVDGRRRHVGVLVGPDGVVLVQPQLHRVERHASWASNGEGDLLQTVDLPFGRVAVVVGDDAVYPETMRLAALQGAEIAIVPFHAQEQWELTLGLPERSAENRVCLVAATRPSRLGASMVTTLWKDFTLMTPWATRPFDGRITAPIVTRAAPEPGVYRATVHPSHAHDKVVSKRTHLLDDRPWAIARAISTRTLP